ncbi:MAG: hypothetical protein WBP87_03465 [Candidatus Sulfotelmatobacter sp.]
MTYVPPATLPKPGQAVLCLIDEIDLGLKPNTFDPSKLPQPKARLVFAVDQLGANGQPFQVSDTVTLTRHAKGDLIKYLSAFVHPNQITPGDWELSSHIGKCIGGVLADNATHTYSNVVSVFPLPSTGQRIGVPAGYVRKGGTTPAAVAYNVQTSTTTPPVNQPKPGESFESSQEKEEAYIPF